MRLISVKGSSDAPKRFFSLRQPLATPRIKPAERLRHTTILSASARLYVRRTKASVSNIAMSKPGARAAQPSMSPRNKVEDPTKHQTDNNELRKNLESIKPALAGRVFRHCAKYHRSHRGKQRHHQEVSQDLLPAAISNASSIVK